MTRFSAGDMLTTQTWVAVVLLFFFIFYVICENCVQTFHKEIGSPMQDREFYAR